MTTPARPTGALINHTLVRRRRLELGLSERKLTALLGVGVSQTVLRGIEAGTNHADLTLGDIARLAHHLDLPMHQLLTPPSAPDVAATDAETAAGPVTPTAHLDTSVRQVAGVLTELNRGIPAQTLAELVELTLTELDEVLIELDTRLRRAGLRLRRLRGDVYLGADDDSIDQDTVRETWRRHLARRSLNLGQAHLLHRAARGEVVKNLGNDERVRGASLVNAGILERTTSGGFELSADTSFSLNPEEPE